jgi:hypothetical protein
MPDQTKFSAEDMQAFLPAEKVGLIASINFDGLPHISMITSLQANGPQQLIAGEFVSGASKEFIQHNHKSAFLIMTFNRSLWRGRATWTHLTKEGPEYERMNLIPMFRYNTYFGINTVHFFDLLEVSERMQLPMPAVIREALKTRLVKGGLKTKQPEPILKPFIQDMFNQMTSLKFLSYVAEDGYPRLIPIIQCQAADSRRVVFSTGIFSDEIKAVPAGSQIAIFCMNFGIQDVLVRGTYRGLQRKVGISMGALDIEWVYNSMPPAVGQVYPPVELKTVTEF